MHCGSHDIEFRAEAEGEEERDQIEGGSFEVMLREGGRIPTGDDFGEFGMSPCSWRW